MTPAVNLLKRNRISFTLHRYTHDANHPSFGLEAAEKLGVNPERVFKTLVVQLDGNDLAVAVLPVSRTLNMKEMARVFQVKKVAMAEAGPVQNTTGYVLGGVSPLAQKKALPTVVDSSAFGFTTIFISGGRRGVEIELDPADMLRLCNAVSESIC
ncbi:MAG: Cys-tRNA(Pro) deacylase [Desulfofustis sp.]|jgi:Cys-tRNA(Pro)/Cys-tRNA(Cys) deacylase|nr:Cys-tRNA(Pro) deacylase [Desulfofustis sp.]